MRVVVSPVLVGDRICRIVSAVDSLLEVEEWVGAWWEPSAIPLTTVSNSAAVSESELRARGVPESDWLLSGQTRPTPAEIEAIILTHDPGRSVQGQFDDSVRRGTGPRRRNYPGNARFKRDSHGHPTTDAERRRNTSGVWTGPRRRSTDPQPPDTAA
jgi:hypothetical protein